MPPAKTAMQTKLVRKGGFQGVLNTDQISIYMVTIMVGDQKEPVVYMLPVYVEKGRVLNITVVPIYKQGKVVGIKWKERLPNIPNAWDYNYNRNKYLNSKKYSDADIEYQAALAKAEEKMEDLGKTLRLLDAPSTSKSANFLAKPSMVGLLAEIFIVA